MKIRSYYPIYLLFALPFVLGATNIADVPRPQSATNQSSIARVEATKPAVPVELDQHHSNHYEWLKIQGFDVQVRFPFDMDLEMQQDYTATLNLLNRQILRAKAVLPQRAIAKLQSKVFFFIKDDCSNGGMVDYWRLDGAEVGWITLHCLRFSSNALEDAYHGGENVYGRAIWGNPTVITHELAHAWQDLFRDLYT